MDTTIEIGNPFHQNTLKNIIKNPKYKGYYTGGLSTVIDYRSKKRNFYKPSDWKIYKDHESVPPIVSEELWEKANNKLSSRSKSAKMYQKHQTRYPLSGKLYCEKHKCAFVRKVRHYKNKEDIVYWYCGNFHKTGRKNCYINYLQEQEIYNKIQVNFKKYEKYKETICTELLLLYNTFLKTEKNITKEYNDKLKKNILKELEITKENLEIYIEELLDKVTVKEDNIIIKTY